MADEVVRIGSARLTGVVVGDAVEFRGIRFARPPVGPLRFRPPQRPAELEGAVHATEYGPVAPQAGSGLGTYVPGDPLEQDEDCLFLNVVAPAGPARRLPVLVFVHGGAFLAGSGSSALYRGAALAALGAVVVTINYRLGALGFLAHPALATDGGCVANWGLYDQLAALAWVRDHIGAFGGDPARVTLFGESAGAMAVADLLAVPAARPLFRRAILQSGASLAAPLEAASAVAERFAAELGLREVSRDALAAVPLADLLAAQQRIVAETDGGEGMPFQPVVDGVLLGRHPAEAIADGAAAGVDLVVGSNRDEYKLFSFAAAGRGELDDAGVTRLIERYLAASGVEGAPLAAAEAVAHYRGARLARGQAAAARDVLDAVAGDWIFRLPQLRLAEAQSRHGRVFAYHFDWESPFAGGVLGACHGLELPFVFGTLDHPVISYFAGTDDDARRLSAEMRACWVAFAGSGDPSNAAVGRWPRYGTERRETMCFGRTTRVEEAPYEAERSFWDRPASRYRVDGQLVGARPVGIALLAGDDGTGT
ncbi:MAG TPA: carboxylesterase family protein [Acidimicrobiales bacterium]|nr:carboxylesterase family protein [Acidimicrobiales bacterium]